MQKGVYSYEYIDHWEKFSKTSLPENHSHLNLEKLSVFSIKYLRSA